MANDWVIEVLKDLQGYASLNELPVLADRLDDVIGVAQGEIESTAPAEDAKGHADAENGGRPGAFG